MARDSKPTSDTDGLHADPQYLTALASLHQAAPEKTDVEFAKGCVAVLAFANLSDDPNQRYFSNGITSDIITELRRFRQLRVRSARDNDVQYVTEGSVRRMGDRIRINVQLVDVSSGEHIWAERFDAKEDEIFGLQDQIVRSIAAQLYERLKIASIDFAGRKPPSSLAAYDYVLQGDALPVGSADAEARAAELFQKAIDLDPNYARPYAHLSSMKLVSWQRNHASPHSVLQEALGFAKKALSLDARDEFSHSTVARAYLFEREHDLAEYHNLKAFALNPNHPEVLTSLGMLYALWGETAKGMTLIREAVAINPQFGPSWYWRARATVHLIAHEYNEAIQTYARSTMLHVRSEAYLAACYAQLDRMEDAKIHLSAALAMDANMNITSFLEREPFRQIDDTKHLANALRKAGLSE